MSPRFPTARYRRSPSVWKHDSGSIPLWRAENRDLPRCLRTVDRYAAGCTRRHDDESPTATAEYAWRARAVKAMAGGGMPRQLTTGVCGPDGVTRCRWATETGRDLTAYHDHEWGMSTHDEAMLFEALALTYFENGLSWATVFDKRDGLRTAFHG